MAYYKEIVTKAVIGKGKRTTKEEYSIKPEFKPDTVLGCWITNHEFSGELENQNIVINSSFDINVWYSYDDNKKTGVVSNTYKYKNKMNVNISSNARLNNETEVIVNALSDPSVLDVRVEGEDILFNTTKEMGVEVVGNTKIKVSAEENYDDYEEIMDEEEIDNIIGDIDTSVNENYIEDEKNAIKED